MGETIRSVFGKEIDTSAIDGFNTQELFAAQPQLLAVENGEPGFVYAWLEANAPQTSLYTRKGLYEIVDPETDPVICSGVATKDGNAYRLNELILARIPEETYKRNKAMSVARALRRESSSEDLYKGTIQGVAKQITPGADVAPTFTVTEEVRVGKASK